MQNEETSRSGTLKLNRETLRALTQTGPGRPEAREPAEPSITSGCCTPSRGWDCIRDEE